jgi:DNA-binding NarL/FixJ family response regulator
VYQGHEFIDPVLREEFLSNMAKFRENTTGNETVPVITQREKDILRLIMAEYTSHEIADKLSLNVRTVDNHRLSLLQKLKAKNTVALAKIVLRMGLLE